MAAPKRWTRTGASGAADAPLVIHIPSVRQGEPLDGRPTWVAVCRCGWSCHRTLSQDAAMNHAADHARSA